MANNNVYNEDIRIIENAIDFATAATGTDTTNLKNFLVNTAGAETTYGMNIANINDEGYPNTITSYNISPSSYYNFFKKGSTGEMSKTLSNINTSFKNMGYGENFDIKDIATVDFDEQTQQYKYSNIDKKLINDPYVSTTLTKSIIDSINKPIPDDINEQATFWKENWNTGGNTDTFVNTHAEYRQNTDVEDHVMDMLHDQDADLFKITPGDLV